MILAKWQHAPFPYRKNAGTSCENRRPRANLVQLFMAQILAQVLGQDLVILAVFLDVSKTLIEEVKKVSV